MSDEIVRRLMSNKSSNLLKESMLRDKLYEKDEDELDTEDDLGIDDMPEEDPVEDTMDEPADMPPPRKPSPKISDEDYLDSEEGTPEDEESEDGDSLELEKDGKPENVNPLDNQYAINFQLGDTVSLAYSNGSPTDVEAVIDGYDKEGFYRIKVSDGMTISGLTDLALASLITRANESKCVCGHKKFVEEGKYVVCDKCGRRIRESSTLPKLPKEKGKIRAEHRPMTTSAKPNISESIKKAFSKKLKEDTDLGIFSSLEELKGEFWTRVPELVDDIESLGYEVLDYNSEYIVVSSDDEDEDEQLVIYLGGTSRTITLDFNRVEIV